jgi:elongation factor Ts
MRVPSDVAPPTVPSSCLPGEKHIDYVLVASAMFSLPKMQRNICLTRNATLLASRAHSTQPSTAQLVKRMREMIDGLSISKAREALAETNNDVEKALEWISKDMAITGARRAEKSKDRKTGEGLVGLSVLSRGTAALPGIGGLRAAIVELNCDIAHTAAYFAEPKEDPTEFISRVDVSALEGAPLISSNAVAETHLSVGDAIRETIAKTGELIVLRRVAAVTQPRLPNPNPNLALRIASYAHGATQDQGRAASLALMMLESPVLSKLLETESFKEELERVERSLARQIVGFSPARINSLTNEDSEALYNQPFAMLSGEPTSLNVGEFLETWAQKQGLVSESSKAADSIAVKEMIRWQVGGADD